jgi:hypothetical protein
MATGGRRDEVDGAIQAWESDLERMRVALANAPEAVNARHHIGFVDLYRHKEIVKSRWETIRGVYQPDTDAVRRFEDAFASMTAAWADAQPLRAEVLAAAAT